MGAGRSQAMRSRIVASSSVVNPLVSSCFCQLPVVLFRGQGVPRAISAWMNAPPGSRRKRSSASASACPSLPGDGSTGGKRSRGRCPADPRGHSRGCKSAPPAGRQIAGGPAPSSFPRCRAGGPGHGGKRHQLQQGGVKGVESEDDPVPADVVFQRAGIEKFPYRH